MFKNMKLGSKIIGGFAVVLIITAIVAYVGYNGLSGTAASVINADDANRMIKWAKDCRLAEKNYIMRADEKYITENHEILDRLYKQVEEIRFRLDDPADIALVENALSEGEKYKSAFDSWVDLHNNRVKEDNVMVQAARAFQAECEKMRKDQKAFLAKELADPNSSTDQINDRIWKGDVANRLIKQVLECRRQEKNFIIRGDKTYIQKNHDATQEIYSLCDELDVRFNKQENKDQVAKIRESQKQYETAINEWVDIYDKQLEEEKMMVASARNIVDDCNKLRENLKEKMDSQISNATSIMLIGALIGIILGSLLAWIITRSITKPISRAINALSEGAEQVGAASEQVASASQSLAEGASEQASSLEETSSSLEEMASMTRQNADNAKQANGLANDTSTSAEKGTNAMQGMSGAMQEIKKSSDETAKIIKVIDEIAFQTNLLALNAAVEAARAGEAGKGFAVVAEEVRNLAQRSAEAAKNTNELIEGSQENADNGVRATEELVGIFKEITAGIKKVTDLMGEVSAASTEQSQGIDQVNTAVSQMDQVTQQNASAAEESSSASEELAAQAQEMASVVDDLAQIVGGSGSVKTTNTQHKHSGPKSDYGKTGGVKQKAHKLISKSHAPIKTNKESHEEMIPLDKEEMVEF